MKAQVWCPSATHPQKLKELVENGYELQINECVLQHLFIQTYDVKEIELA